jgi:hypothetical protein
MKDYKSALEVLEPLDELKKDISSDALYLETLSILEDSKISIEDKSQRLIEIYKKSHQLAYIVFEYLFRVNPKLAWKNFDSSKSEKMIDILWHVKKEDLDFDIIRQNSYLRELYSARGDVKLASKSNVFEFDVLINLDGKANATLSFEYICDNCKQVYPFSFHRCSHCHSIDSIGVEFSLRKDFHRDFSEENNSFQ